MPKPELDNIIWPAVIIGLLTLSGLTVFAVVWAAQSDGGAQIVPDYYRQSVLWDSIATAREASAQLGWAATIELAGEAGERHGVLSITDSVGTPLAGLSGSVSVFRPQTTKTYGTFELEAIPEKPGRYRFDFPFSDQGLWDLSLQVDEGTRRFARKVRIEN